MSRAMLQEASIVELHEKWMAQFGQTYVDSAEKEKRFKIFKENYEYVERFNNAGNKTYKIGINAFSDLTNEEFQASHTGSKMPISNPRFSKTITSFKYQNLTNEVPENVDWRDRGVVTDVKNQGRCEMAAVEGIVKIKTGEVQQLSEQQLLDCVQLSNDCSCGNIESAYNYIVENSIARESSYQYQEHKGPCESVTRRRRPRKLPRSAVL
ncbi:hypothetical protein QYF36_012813 [Acer negundo]|nr:hypothetical protein QYF36_012813 [Acer negundo]